MAVPCMGSIQRFLCITFMTSQSHLWCYCCIMMSHGPWLLRRCLKRGFGDHRKQPIYEFNWIVSSIAVELIKTANRMAKIITLLENEFKPLLTAREVESRAFVLHPQRLITDWRVCCHVTWGDRSHPEGHVTTMGRRCGGCSVGLGHGSRRGCGCGCGGPP